MNWPKIRFIPAGPQFEGDDAHRALGGDDTAPVNRPTADLEMRTNILKRIVVANWHEHTVDGAYLDSFRAVREGVAVGGYGGLHTLDANGVSWTYRTPDGAFVGFFFAVTKSPSLWVAVGENGEIQTSPNGATWTARTAAASYTGQLLGVVYASFLGLLVAVGESGEIQTSPDGVNWTHRTAASSYTGAFRAVASAPDLGLVVAVGESGEIQTSPDGVNWTHRTSNAGDDIIAVTWSPLLGRLVAIDAYIADQILVSDDGESWDNHGAFGASVEALAWSDELGLFVAAGEQIASSDDGVTWTVLAQAPSTLYGIDAGQRIIVACGASAHIQSSMRF